MTNSNRPSLVRIAAPVSSRNQCGPASGERNFQPVPSSFDLRLQSTRSIGVQPHRRQNRFESQSKECHVRWRGGAVVRCPSDGFSTMRFDMRSNRRQFRSGRCRIDETSPPHGDHTQAPFATRPSEAFDIRSYRTGQSAREDREIHSRRDGRRPRVTMRVEQKVAGRGPAIDR